MDWHALLEELRASGALIVIGRLALIVIVTFIALRFAHVTVAAALDRLFRRESVEGTARDVSAGEIERRRQTLDGLVYRALRVMILVIAFLMVLEVLRLDIGPAIAGLGIIGLALSLGAQHLVRDYVAGAFVLIENQYSKGDIISIAGVSGTVEDVSLRRTTLRDFDGTVHYVPNGLIQTASNLTRSWAGISLDLPVPYEQGLEVVQAAVERAAQRLADDPDWQGRILKPPHVVGVERIAEQGLVLRVSGSVTAPQRLSAASLLRSMIVEEAARSGVVIGWRAVPDSPRGGSTPPATPAPNTDRNPAKDRSTAEGSAVAQADDSSG